MAYTDEFGNIYGDDYSTDYTDPVDIGEPPVNIGGDDTTDYAGHDYGYTRNEDGSSQRFNSDGSVTYQDPDGQVYTVNPNNTYTTNWGGSTYTYDPAQSGFVDDSGKLIVGGINSSVTGKSLWDKIRSAISANPMSSALTAAAALKTLYDRANQTGGYNKAVPKLDATRARAPYAQDPNRRPGEAGRSYFSTTAYTPQGDTAALTAAQTAANTQAAGILAAAPPSAAPAPNPYAGKMPTPWNTLPEETKAQGTANMAKGGIADAGRYLQGKTDGMADEIPTSIDGQQDAALSHGEFVIPADVVSHLGNGNSDAGAEKLYQMMARIRKARTGTEKQGKQIDPDKFMPGGLAAAYAGGGAVQRFDGGGTVPATTTTGTTGGGIPLDTSRTSTLSPWVGDYVTDALSKGQALANRPYEAYTGPLTAGPSDLQQQAFAGISQLASAGYTPSGTPSYSSVSGGNVASTFQQPDAYKTGTFTNEFKAPTPYTTGQFDANFQAPTPYATGQFANTFNAPTPYETGQFTNAFTAPKEYQGREFSLEDFGADQVQKYVNPYIQYAIEPQLRELQRQADIQRTADAGRLTQAGAFGGSRQAIMESEGRRNLLDKQSDILGAGYASAYDKALAQYNTSQAAGLEAQKASEASRQFGAGQALSAAQLQAQYGLSAQQAQEASRQFGAGQGMTAAQLIAQYGMTAQQAAEASRQFGASQGLTAADLAAKYRLSEQQAQEASRQFGSAQGVTVADLMAKYGMTRQQAEEASRQFGASLGLTAATTAAQQSMEAQKANQLASIEAGKANQTAALQAAKDAEASRQFSANFGLGSIRDLAGLGAVQRGITAEGIAADKAQFEEQREYDYKMPQYQLGLLSGLPIGANTTSSQQTGLAGTLSDVSGLGALYKQLQALGADLTK